MLLLPIGQEDNTVRRTPWVTIALIAANVVAFLLIGLTSGDAEREAEARMGELLAYVEERPYLSFPPYLARRLGPAAVAAIESRQSEQSLGGGPVDRALAQAEQEQLNLLCEEATRALAALPSARYGFTPAAPRPLKALSSLFVHAGWMHLLGNMLFLTVCGPFLEDIYGRAVFPGLYLVAGVVATATHAAVFPSSGVPLVGASGAIAGVLGAFLVRLGGSHIRFLLLPIPFLPMIRTQLHLPAFVVLPFWLGQQVWYGSTDGGGSGTAWWAHVGGFAFGAVVALALKLSRIEEAWVRPGVDKKADPSHGSLDRARRARLGGDVPTARREILAALEAAPDSAEVWEEAYELALEALDTVGVGQSGERLMELSRRSGNAPTALKVARDPRWRGIPGLPARFVLAAAACLERAGDGRGAVELCERVVAESPGEADALRALVRCGEILRRSGDANGARATYERARAHPACTDHWTAIVDMALAQLASATSRGDAGAR